MTAARPLSALVHDFLPNWHLMDWPTDWDTVFGRRAKRTVEVGFGNGEFLIHLATRHPGEDFLGIEIAWASVSRLLRRIEDAGLTNVRVLQGDGAFLLDRVFAPESLHRVVANNSDPWPKERHHGRRLIQEAFLTTVASRLVPGGTVLIATDHAEYAEWIAERLEGQDRLLPIQGATRTTRRSDLMITRYQSKALEVGIPINYFEWGKPAEAPPEPRPHPQGKETMPNVLLQGTPGPGPLVPGAGPDVFRETHQDTEVVIKVLHRYHRDSGDWLVETLTREGEFGQRFAVTVSPRDDDRLVVRLAELGAPRLTWAVKRAVHHVAELVLSAHPDLQVVGSTVGAVDEGGQS